VRWIRWLDRALAALNALPMGGASVVVDGNRLYTGTLDRWLAAQAWRFGWLEAAELRFVRAAVRPGMVAVDVGANVGLYTLILSRLVGTAGRVHALEPAPANLRALGRAIEHAGATNVVVHAAAAGDRAGEVALHLAPGNQGDHRIFPNVEARATIPVPSVVLDDLLATEPRVDFVKIDVQGAELPVLRGLRRTLAGNPDVRVLCEITPWLFAELGQSAEEFFAPLRAAALAPHRLRDDGSLEPCDERRAWGEVGAAGFANVVFQRAGATSST
jgi:FkbM family methyltransferase